MTVASSFAESKQGLRREIRARLKAILRPDLKISWDQQIHRFLEQVLPSQGGLGAAYMSLSDEPTISAAASSMSQWRWVWPRVVGENLSFHEANDAGLWVTSPYGIKEPPASAPAVSLDQCNVVCVPGVAFDRCGARLGRGKGFYDRALRFTKAIKIGVAYSAQVLNDNLPFEPHDVRMDYLVTEKFILKPKG